MECCTAGGEACLTAFGAECGRRLIFFTDPHPTLTLGLRFGYVWGSGSLRLQVEAKNPSLVIMPKFVPRQRKQKHRQREATNAPVDTNVAELAPVSKSEKDAKRQQLKEELRAQHAQISSKKQKRLDKYIVCG